MILSRLNAQNSIHRFDDCPFKRGRYEIGRGGDVLMEIWIPETTEILKCTLRRSYHDFLPIAEFRSSGGIENKILLRHHGCELALTAANCDNVEIFIPAMTTHPPLQLVWAVACDLKLHLTCVTYGLANRSVCVELGLFKTRAHHFEYAMPEYIKYLLQSYRDGQDDDKLHRKAHIVWQAWNPWSVGYILVFIKKWNELNLNRNVYTNKPAIALLRWVSRDVLQQAHICPFLLDHCTIVECTSCPESIGVIKDAFKMNTNEWDQLLWPFLGGYRECDIPTPACCEWLS